MRTSHKLRKEIYEPQSDVFAPYLYKYEGMKSKNAECIPIMKAWGIHSLFSSGTPFIFKNDMIAGSVRGHYKSKDDISVIHAKRVMEVMKERDFRTNSDHYSPNYPKIVKAGIPALIKEIELSLDKFSDDDKKTKTLESMKIAMAGFLEMIGNYAKKATELKNTEGYNNDRLDFIAANCTALTKGAPQTFAQALQLVWLCHTAFLLEERYAMALGRMDQYLYPFYKADIESGILTNENAIELLENVFAKCVFTRENAVENDVVNIVVGGMDKNLKCQVNDLSYCIVEAVKNNMAPGPNLSARVTENTPDEFFDAALKSIGTGLGYPALMNDRVNIEALKKYGYDEDDIYDYTMVGCIENFMTGKQPPWSDGRFDTLKYLDYVFNNGKTEFNKSVGIDTGDIDNIISMDDFVKKFEQQLEFGVNEYCMLFNAKNDFINQEYFSSPFLSCFCDNCIETGLDINNGGSKYPSAHGVGIMGIGTVCDSLAAIEKVVFTDKTATLSQIKDAINANFEGYDELHQLLLAAPKYGNNDDFVDKYAIWLVDYISSLFLRHKTRDGGGVYIAIASNVSNIYSGEVTAATPDGRKQGEPLSDAASPTYGKDINGVTSTLASTSKADYTKVATGSVINQKFPPSVFADDSRPKLISLIKSYLKMGGQEIQINSTSREVLEDAMNNPGKYANLVVRVSGFSDYYTRLAKEVQKDILSRTQQTL